MQPRLVSVTRFATSLVAFGLCAFGTGCRKRAAEQPAPPTSTIAVPLPDGPPLSAEAEKSLTQMVQAAVGEYFKQHKRYPNSVTELQGAGLLELIQAPPAGRKFVINPADGRFSVQPR